MCRRSRAITRFPSRRARAAGLALLGLAVLGCGDPVGGEPGQVQLGVAVVAEGVTECTTDLGWRVRLDQARVAVADPEFTIEGETHATRWPRLTDWLVRAAHAHPGHYAGGEVTGELPGAFLLQFVPPAEGLLGQAALLPGMYEGFNLRFRHAAATEARDGGDPLPGHTALLAGQATRGQTTIRFQALLDVAEGTQMVGGPCVLTVDAATRATLGLTLYTIDPSEGDTLFDGLDFAALDGDGDGAVTIQPGETAHNILMKTLIRHDHWGIVVR